MAARKIILTPKAEDDLREMFLYFSEFSLNAADTQIDIILDKIDLLLQFPRIGRVIPEYENDKLRELPAGNYLVAYYIASDEQIDVLAIHHGGKPKGR